MEGEPRRPDHDEVTAERGQRDAADDQVAAVLAMTEALPATPFRGGDILRGDQRDLATVGPHPVPAAERVAVALQTGARQALAVRHGLHRRAGRGRDVDAGQRAAHLVVGPTVEPGEKATAS